MQANSRQPFSAQKTVHDHLPALLERHRRSSFRKPYADYNRLALAAGIERWQRLAPALPLILDAGCGTGESSLTLAALFPDHYVIGVDQSVVRLRRRLEAQERGEPHRALRQFPSGGVGAVRELTNVGFVRADLVDFWRLMRDANIRLARHYLFYPNPWPKIGHLSRRWHAHPVFPTLVELGGVLECRSNWRIYIEEFCLAIGTMTGREILYESFAPDPPQTPFERKYLVSGHTLYRARVDLLD